MAKRNRTLPPDTFVAPTDVLGALSLEAAAVETGPAEPAPADAPSYLEAVDAAQRRTAGLEAELRDARQLLSALAAKLDATEKQLAFDQGRAKKAEEALGNFAATHAPFKVTGEGSRLVGEAYVQLLELEAATPAFSVLVRVGDAVEVGTL